MTEESPHRERTFLKSLLAGLTIILLTAGATATAALLEIKEFVPEQDTGPPIVPEGRARGRQARQAADAAAHRLGPPLDRQEERRPGAVGHDDAPAPRPRPAGDDRCCRSRATCRSRSRATGPRRSTTPTRSAARRSPRARSSELTGLKINHVINVNFGGVPRGGQRAELLLHRHRPALLPLQRGPAAEPALRRDRRPGRLPEALRRGRPRRTCASATPTTTSSAPPASRTSCARPRTRSARAR